MHTKYDETVSLHLERNEFLVLLNPITPTCITYHKTETAEPPVVQNLKQTMHVQISFKS